MTNFQKQIVNLVYILFSVVNCQFVNVIHVYMTSISNNYESIILLITVTGIRLVLFDILF